jgi:hypothetical protein
MAVKVNGVERSLTRRRRRLLQATEMAGGLVTIVCS